MPDDVAAGPASPLSVQPPSARNAAGLKEARVIMYRRPKDYRANFYSAAPAPTPGLASSLQQLTALLSGSGPRFLYLWWP